MSFKNGIRSLALGLVVLAPSIAAAEVLWRGDFSTGDLSQWSSKQMVSDDRIQVVADPLGGAAPVARVLVKQGDNPIGASGNRNELLHFPDEEEGNERWYQWSTMWANDFPSVDTWQIFTQWHHRGCCGAPPVQFFVVADNVMLKMRGTDGNVFTGNNAKDYTLAPLVRGVWHTFVFHVFWSNDPSRGFIALSYDGQQLIPKTSMATLYAGMTSYMKQGQYRDAAVAQDGVVYHRGMVVGTTEADVLPAAPSAGTTAGTAGSGLTPNDPSSATPASASSVGCSSGAGQASPTAVLLGFMAAALFAFFRRSVRTGSRA